MPGVGGGGVPPTHHPPTHPLPSPLPPCPTPRLTTSTSSASCLPACLSAFDIARSANSDEDDGGLVVVVRPLLLTCSGEDVAGSVQHCSQVLHGYDTVEPPPPLHPALMPCPAALKEPGDGTPRPVVTAYGVL